MSDELIIHTFVCKRVTRIIAEATRVQRSDERLGYSRGGVFCEVFFAKLSNFTCAGAAIVAKLSRSKSLYKSRQNSSGASSNVSGFCSTKSKLDMPSCTITSDNRSG